MWPLNKQVGTSHFPFLGLVVGWRPAILWQQVEESKLVCLRLWRLGGLELVSASLEKDKAGRIDQQGEDSDRNVVHQSVLWRSSKESGLNAASLVERVLCAGAGIALLILWV